MKGFANLGGILGALMFGALLGTLSGALLLTLSGCANAANLERGEYEILSFSVGGKPLAVPPEASFVVEKGEIYGNAGCNNYFSRFSVAGEVLRFSHAGATKMMCHDEATNAFESAFLQGLAGDFRVESSGENVALKRGDFWLELRKK